ncbi:photosystem I reaction center subunit PsaK [Calothrix sp. NIES-3974]|uniref:photosystem I reaction center subunit PsaK n=1 Tax=Calothrix sp. NIES-3974 TaxID=2005462 RepID=UPI000B5FBBDA|nr:photosystem I reaction center subunit PsaK [Calothrix sp. NIES-3974]BAZ07260.1 hypothetical protein NIES3974_39230 [Calothrix sp. NIES-3974]
MKTLLMTASVPTTLEWNPGVAIVIGICCILTLVVTLQINRPMVGPKFPLLPMSIPAFVAAMCLGHIVGVGVILGLANLGRF